ncbi:MAG: NADP-dependent malic enzyme [Candidatus Cloacimonetes bacterium]|nr:NADP-dependent malic enzyme [Candidatus Cloacimonadota bacterium]
MNNDFLTLNLENLERFFPDNFSEEELAKGKTLLLKKLSLVLHKFYNGKTEIIPKVGLYGFNWFNIWYTPGVSAVSTAIRDDNELSYDLTNRGNTVAIVSDSTRVLGDGDCTPPGGLGVMEGKALLMKMLGGIDAIPLCIDSRDVKGNNNPYKMIDFVKMVQHSFGAVNLEDISQPNCYKVLDTLREECDIPVWHDDAQGTASVTLAGLINALKLVNKKMGEIKTVFLGAGASNTAIARITVTAGVDPQKIIMFDAKGALSNKRNDIERDETLYRKWEICLTTNPNNVTEIENAVKDADVLIALSKPGPDAVEPKWIKSMNNKPIVFACANPIPEIYPYAAKQAGAYIVATGRGDFPNQINNSLGFPGILKGALIVRASKITDGMAIAAAQSLAEYAEKRGITPENIIPKMTETDVFPLEALAVARKAIEEGVAGRIITDDEIFKRADTDIKKARATYDLLSEQNIIPRPDMQIIKSVIDEVVKEVRSKS